MFSVHKHARSRELRVGRAAPEPTGRMAVESTRLTGSGAGFAAGVAEGGLGAGAGAAAGFAAGAAGAGWDAATRGSKTVFPHLPQGLAPPPA